MAASSSGLFDPPVSPNKEKRSLLLKQLSEVKINFAGQSSGVRNVYDAIYNQKWNYEGVRFLLNEIYGLRSQQILVLPYEGELSENITNETYGIISGDFSKYFPIFKTGDSIFTTDNFPFFKAILFVTSNCDAFYLVPIEKFKPVVIAAFYTNATKHRHTESPIKHLYPNTTREVQKTSGSMFEALSNLLRFIPQNIWDKSPSFEYKAYGSARIHGDTILMEVVAWFISFARQTVADSLEMGEANSYIFLEYPHLLPGRSEIPPITTREDISSYDLNLGLFTHFLEPPIPFDSSHFNIQDLKSACWLADFCNIHGSLPTEFVEGALFPNYQERARTNQAKLEALVVLYSERDGSLRPVRTFANLVYREIQTTFLETALSFVRRSLPDFLTKSLFRNDIEAMQLAKHIFQCHIDSFPSSIQIASYFDAELRKAFSLYKSHFSKPSLIIQVIKLCVYKFTFPSNIYAIEQVNEYINTFPPSVAYGLFETLRGSSVFPIKNEKLPVITSQYAKVGYVKGVCVSVGSRNVSFELLFLPSEGETKDTRYLSSPYILKTQHGRNLLVVSSALANMGFISQTRSSLAIRNDILTGLAGTSKSNKKYAFQAVFPSLPIPYLRDKEERQKAKELHVRDVFPIMNKNDEDKMLDIFQLCHDLEVLNLTSRKENDLYDKQYERAENIFQAIHDVGEKSIRPTPDDFSRLAAIFTASRFYFGL